MNVFVLLFWGTNDLHNSKTKTMEVFVPGVPELLCFQHSSEYLPLCSAEQRNSYRFGTTWKWVNDDRILISWWTIHLSALFHWPVELRPTGHETNNYQWTTIHTNNCSMYNFSVTATMIKELVSRLKCTFSGISPQNTWEWYERLNHSLSVTSNRQTSRRQRQI